jgi:hypothetical protein
LAGGAVEAHAVGALFIDMKVEGDALGAQGGGEHEAVLELYAIVFPCVKEETWRGGWSNLKLGGEVGEEAGGGIGAE